MITFDTLFVVMEKYVNVNTFCYVENILYDKTFNKFYHARGGLFIYRIFFFDWLYHGKLTVKYFPVFL